MSGISELANAVQSSGFGLRSFRPSSSGGWDLDFSGKPIKLQLGDDGLQCLAVVMRMHERRMLWTGSV